MTRTRAFPAAAIALALTVSGCLAPSTAVREPTGEPCASSSGTAPWRPLEVRIGAREGSFDDLGAALASARVIAIGEVHDRFDHHLS